MKIDRQVALKQALRHLLEVQGQSPALKTELDKLQQELGASADEIRAALQSLGDKFEPDGRRALERLLSVDDSRSFKAPATKGKKAHDVRGKQKPWFAAVKDAPALGPPLHTEPRRDVALLGVPFSRDEVDRLLKRVS